jgi:hypothetical protein
MWWIDLGFGFWNGITAWIVFIVHLFGGWAEFPLYDIPRSGGWYDLGFLVGAGSPLLGAGSSRRFATDASDRPRTGRAIEQASSA